MERQKHGFEYENGIKEKYNLLERSYTDMWDANDENSKKWVIKTFKKGSELPLSDIFVNSKRDEDFYLQIGIWENSKKNIIKEILIYVDIEKWQKQFEYDSYDILKHWIKYEVSNLKEYDKVWKSEIKEWKEKWGKERMVQPRFKRDHKKQKRIQSAVSNKNLENFLESIKKISIS
jgi:hypothetical protein